MSSCGILPWFWNHGDVPLTSSQRGWGFDSGELTQLEEEEGKKKESRLLRVVLLWKLFLMERKIKRMLGLI